jgi:hypothetical protein
MDYLVKFLTTWLPLQLYNDVINHHLAFHHSLDNQKMEYNHCFQYK